LSPEALPAASTSVATNLLQPAPAEAVAAPPLVFDPPLVKQDARLLLVRTLEVLPGALALAVIASLIAGHRLFPVPLLVGVILFQCYWLWKSWTIGFHAIKGLRVMRAWLQRDWRAEYRSARKSGKQVLPWKAIRHVVIIPNYKESESKLRATLTTLARCRGARFNVIPVLAMEGAEPGADAKGQALAAEFDGLFAGLLVTLHPANLPGEVRGKSANEAWAARRTVEQLVERGAHSIDHLTVTSCDADTQFPEGYFEALTCLFATDQRRYRRFWQAPIFFYNNIWQVPGPLRIPNALSGLIHLGRLSRKRRVLFSQSTYSLSMRLARDVGYWDTDIIPEDWHMFLKCFYETHGAVDVEPLMFPVGNDGALSTTTPRSLINHYLQVRRWGWGASDIPYAVLQCLRHPEIPLRRRLLRCWYLIDNHISWSTQWFIITLGALVPFLHERFGYRATPDWFFLENLTGLSWLPGWLSISGVIMTPCLAPFLILIILDSRLRPPAPATTTRLSRAASHFWWLASSPITFFCSALPALDAQVRLMLGRRMEYRVTEKV
jgi:hypothetical protein